MDLTPALTNWDLFLRLGAAAAAGALIGLNRDLQHKPAGMRTHALVSIGAAGITLLGLLAAWDGEKIVERRAVTQVLQGIITGIGFLGAGVILRYAAGQQIHGLTTAATIWLAAAFGMVCGAAYWPAAGLLVVFTFVILVLGRFVEDAALRFWSREKKEDVKPGKR
jgi:putative Mg2+ transporter-C (MgtC) family protein